MVEITAEVTDSQMTTVLTCVSRLTLDCFLIEQRGNKKLGKCEKRSERLQSDRGAERGPAGART